jgi:hypothetical protein
MFSRMAAARRVLQRRRRIVAAGCAACAVLLIFGSHAEPAPETTPALMLQPGEDAVPVQVSGASSLHPGDVLDLVAASDSEPAHIIAHDVRVLALPEQAVWTGGSGATVLVAMGDQDALRAITASAAGSLIPVVQAP